MLVALVDHGVSAVLDDEGPAAKGLDIGQGLDEGPGFLDQFFHDGLMSLSAGKRAG
jgi:hypothetical protein